MVGYDADGAEPCLVSARIVDTRITPTTASRHRRRHACFCSEATSGRWLWRIGCMVVLVTNSAMWRPITSAASKENLKWNPA